MSSLEPPKEDTNNRFKLKSDNLQMKKTAVITWYEIIIILFCCHYY